MFTSLDDTQQRISKDCFPIDDPVTLPFCLSLPSGSDKYTPSYSLIYCRLFWSGSVTRIDFASVEETTCELSITTAN